MDQQILSVKQRFGIIGNSTKLNYAIQIAVQVSATDLTVLITGESGSGKESFSKIIHQLSHRKHGPFIAINCGAIPEGTIDSELFGHEKGAFTGASEARKGYFEVTDGGTIFLDEIGEMPLETQARLLRVLENKEFIRVGSSKVQKTNVRVVAATNVDLLKRVEQGKFREDLYYRLNTVPIFVPPLRERGDDIDLLFRKFTTDFAENYHTKPLQLTPEAKDILLNFRFPGNIRQLRNIVERMSVLQVERTVTADDMMKYLPDFPGQRFPALIESGKGDDTKGNFSERDILYKVLFDLKQDMTDLKKLVLNILQNDDLNSHEIIKENQHLFGGIEPDSPSRNITKEPERTPLLISNRGNSASRTYDLDGIEDVPLQQEEESLSLQKNEKEMIIKALRKNNNKRKYAARDLGISERTLYRKIKQYEIED